MAQYETPLKLFVRVEYNGSSLICNFTCSKTSDPPHRYRFVDARWKLNCSITRITLINVACTLHNLAENWSWARDVNGWDRDETDTLTIFLETRPRRDVDTSRDRDVETETTTLGWVDKQTSLAGRELLLNADNSNQLEWTQMVRCAVLQTIGRRCLVSALVKDQRTEI